MENNIHILINTKIENLTTLLVEAVEEGEWEKAENIGKAAYVVIAAKNAVVGRDG